MLQTPAFQTDDIHPQEQSNQSDDTMADDDDEMDVHVDNEEYSNGNGADVNDAAYEDDEIVQSEHDDDDDEDDDFDDDEPLDTQIRNRGQRSSGRVANGYAAGQNGQDEEDDEDDYDDDDDEDDLPLSSRIPSSSREQRPSRRTQQAAASIGIQWDSEDDIPLAELQQRKVGKSKQPTKSSKTATKRRRSEPGSGARAKSTSKPKPKKQDSKRPKKEKEEDASTRKFEKPGQRKEAPSTSDPARLFYQSLYEQKLAKGKPSHMAENWMLRHGLLEDDVAEQVLSRIKAAK